MELLDRWDDNNDPEGRAIYMTFAISDGKVDVKCKADGFIYVMDSGNGGEVYINSDDGIRDLTKKETEEIIGLTIEQLKVEAEMEAKYENNNVQH